MTDVSNEWTLEGFVDHFDFVHHKMLDHKYVWVLGAGASHASGIPLGSQLVDQWLKEIHLRENGGKLPLQAWATDQELEIKDFKFEERASFYPKIYQRRFRDYPDEGYAYLESVMSGKDPSPGYSILAAALAVDPPRHNVVITTNFDNLVADALSIYTDTFPFVAGHESLTGFVRVSMRRPLICKIHRDLLLGPQNDPRSLKRLHDAWGTALRALFQHYTPLFIGYGGNDDTLMDLLESLQPSDIKGELIWCYYEQVTPSERIVDVVTNLNGVLIPVPDFDLLMVLLGERMQINLLDEEISKRASKKTQRYRDRIQRLDTVTYPNVARALAATFERSGGWWAWHQKAQLEKDPLRRDAVYEQGIQYRPKDAEMYAMYARDLDKRRERDKADALYRKALLVDPASAPVMTNFAVFLMGDSKQWDESEKMIRRALEYDSDNASRICVLADILSVCRKSDEAEKYYKEAIDSDESPANASGNYACFLISRGRLAEAADMVEQAKLFNDEVNQLAAELALYTAILERLAGRDDSQPINELRQLFATGFERLFWNFDAMLEFAKNQLSTEDHALFSALAVAIIDERELARAETLLLQRKDPAKQRKII